MSDRGWRSRPSSLEREALLAVARAAVRAAASGRPPPPLPPDRPSRLDEPTGAFVSLHQGAALRGCIGNVAADVPLATLVSQIAAAATRDPRFAPLAPAELEGLHVEISILSPLRAVPLDVLDPATHGVCIRLGQHRAVLLPQVAARRGWDRATLLGHLCEKAGLPPAAWQDAAALVLAFTVEIVEGDV